MKINIFIKELENALIERGISEETAKKHVLNLSRSFTSDDLGEIEAINSASEISELAESIAAILNKTKKTAPAKQTKLENSIKPVDTVPSEKSLAQNEDRKHPIQVSAKNESPLYSEPAFFNNKSDEISSNRGVTIFWVALVVTLPITIGLLLIYFGAFACAFAALIGIIVAAIAALVTLVAAGAAVSLVGIIYGVTQLFSFPAAGIYEIGLGVMVAGAVLFVSILIYNLAIRFIPRVISWLSVFFKFTFKKLIVLFDYARKECYKL